MSIFLDEMGKMQNPLQNAEDFGDRDRIQTCNRLIRSQLLYSVELRDLVKYCRSDRDRIQTCNRLIRSQLLYSVELRGHSVFRKSDRDRIQTCNRLIRSQLLYSVELRDHCFVFNGCKDTYFSRISKRLATFLRKIIR